MSGSQTETAKCQCGEFCYISTESSSHTRRCFMTGEYCSQKTNIQRERKKLYNDQNGEIAISAFVIMNFSDMSDVVYKWRIKKFIESLHKYLYMDVIKNRLYCCSEESNISGKSNFKRISRINVIRSDSDPASNYVICSRICQQMQIADLVIVDVSTQNPNVFYEFGMAVALEKMILPICFSESFYKLEVPEKLKKLKAENDRNASLWNSNEKNPKDDLYDKILNHIGCYPWRKTLFEYYGIRFKQNTKKGDEEEKNSASIQYITYADATKEAYGFTDIQYNRFPYDEIIETEEKDKGVKIGVKIYNSNFPYLKWDSHLEKSIL